MVQFTLTEKPTIGSEKPLRVQEVSDTEVQLVYSNDSSDGETLILEVPTIAPPPPITSENTSFFLPPYIANQSAQGFYLGQTYYPLAITEIGTGYLKIKDAGSTSTYDLISPSDLSLSDRSDLLAFFVYQVDAKWEDEIENGNYVAANFPTPTPGRKLIFKNVVSSKDTFLFSIGSCSDLVKKNSTEGNCSQCGAELCVSEFSCINGVCTPKSGVCSAFGLRFSDDVLTYSPSSDKRAIRTTKTSELPVEGFKNSTELVLKEQWFFADTPDCGTQFVKDTDYSLYLLDDGKKKYLKVDGSDFVLEDSPDSDTFTFRPTKTGNYGDLVFDKDDFKNWPYDDRSVQLWQNSSLIGTPAVVEGSTGQIKLNPATAPSGQINQNYSFSVTASEGTAPYTFMIDGTLPQGLAPVSLTSNPLVIMGIPTMLESSTVTVNVTDSNQLTGSISYTIDIQESSSLQISTTSLPAGQTGSNYLQTLNAEGGTPPYSWSLSAGTLPSGLTLGSSGILSGTPLNTGTSNFTVLATDSASNTATQALTLTINQPSSGPSSQSIFQQWWFWALIAGGILLLIIILYFVFRSPRTSEDAQQKQINQALMSALSEN